jgi:hypothetical protein
MHMAMGLWEAIPRSGEFQEILETAERGSWKREN